MARRAVSRHAPANQTRQSSNRVPPFPSLFQAIFRRSKSNETFRAASRTRNAILRHLLTALSTTQLYLRNALSAASTPIARITHLHSPLLRTKSRAEQSENRSHRTACAQPAKFLAHIPIDNQDKRAPHRSHATAATAAKATRPKSARIRQHHLKPLDS